MSNDYKIQMKYKEDKAYTEKVCVACSISENEMTSQVTFEQTSKCSKSLDNVGIPVIKHDVKYDEDETEVQLGVGWKSFFKNNDETICPITYCSLLAPGCKSSY